MEAISTPDGPPPRGHYSQAVVHNGLVFVSAQLPIAADGTALIESSAGDQARAVLANIDAVLLAAGSGLDRAIQITIYVSDIDNWGEVNEAYADVLGDHKPARAVIPVGDLPHGVALEMQAIGAVAP
jgi:2-iminobutanoate/2-iminopropanoate deaminase